MNDAGETIGSVADMLPRSLRNRNLLDEQRTGTVHGVFIDDSGSPGLANTPNNLHQERKTWAAVIVPKSHLSEVWAQFPCALDELKAQTGASEFHFGDIYAGRREFRGLALEKRLGLFAFMAYIFKSYGLTSFVQTLDPDTLEQTRKAARFPERLGPFHLTKHEDFALFILLVRVKQHLENRYAESDRRARVFVDEGYKKNGAAISIPPFDRVFCEGLIRFGKSDIILPLQLADCAAFCLNRTQLLFGKPELTEIDTAFLEIVQPVIKSFENTCQVPVDDWFPENPIKQ